MPEAPTTNFSGKTDILAELWMDYRTDEEFSEFIEHNDLGLPLAYAIAEGIVEVSDKAKVFVEQSFDALLEHLEIEDDGFVNLEELLDFSEASKNILEQ
jgi:alpha-D-ribose 1-methylphosphonate 5-triphosphate synthase subunit PhnL